MSYNVTFYFDQQDRIHLSTCLRSLLHGIWGETAARGFIAALHRCRQPFRDAQDMSEDAMESIDSGRSGAEQLRIMRREYEGQLPGKVEAIEAIWRRLIESGWREETMRELYLLLHRLEGAAGTYGYLSLNSTAHALCSIVDRCLEAGGFLDQGEHLEHFERMLDHLREQATDPQSTPAFPERAREGLEACTCVPRPFVQDGRLVFLVEDDQTTAYDLALQIERFGYSVRIFPSLQNFREAKSLRLPAAVIMDVVFPEGSMAGVKAIAEIQDIHNVRIPTIFISVKMDFATRLSAIRAGGQALFTKPISASLLVDKLDALLSFNEPEPYRVLIVEDDRSQADFYSLLLRQAGMIARTVTKPTEALESLVELHPDLILMDLYMPDCNGLELAAIIRQEEAFVSIPIVFLSVETDLTKQLAALGLGGDDFFSKPINPGHFIPSITARLERARILRTFMVRDCMTGLFNHTRIKEQLEIELSRACRRHTTVSFALLDLDCFKSVNDTYGHQAGDRVIKSLARVLRQRLRKMDIIGRYGGEEFAVIFPVTKGDDALKVMNEVRESFAEIRQRCADTEFNVTFSCGIATYPPYGDSRSLTNAADRALYEAKRTGRNRVEMLE